MTYKIYSLYGESFSSVSFRLSNRIASEYEDKASARGLNWYLKAFEGTVVGAVGDGMYTVICSCGNPFLIMGAKIIRRGHGGGWRLAVEVKDE